jgi:hypothetical protein
METRSVQEIILGRLAMFLGPNTARVALKTFAARTGRSPEALTRADVPEVLAALLPMLRTLIGRERAESLVRQLAQEAE